MRDDAGVDPITGKRRQVTKVIHGGKRQANDELRRLIAEAESGVATNAKRTVYELAKDWLDFKRGELSSKTIELYDQCLQRHISPTRGRRKVHTLTPRDLDLFYGALAEKGMSAYGIHQVHATIW